MGKNIEGLTQLKGTLEDFLEGYQERRRTFREFPKVDIDGIFSIWDNYLAFLDKNKEAEEKERERVTKDLREKGIIGKDETLGLVELTGGFDDVLHKIAKPFSDDHYSKLLQVYPDIREGKVHRAVEVAFKDRDLSAFFFHDINHIFADLNQQFWTIFSPKADYGVNRMRNCREEVRRFLERYNSNPESLYGAYLEPYKMLHFIITTELGEKPMSEQFQPAKLAMQIALILQNRYVQAEYSLVERLTDSKTNEIAVDAEEFTLNGNSGVVFSIIYNLAKNAYKKLGGKANNSQKIFMQVYEALPSSYVVTVGDSGKPIDLNVMKDKVRQLVLEKGIDNVSFPTNGSKKRYQRWQNSEYKVGDLTVKDITDVAFMARMSGFDNADKFSSGMGLYGVRYFLNNVGGKILYGENFENGGPLFTCVIPKKFPSNGIERHINSMLSKIPEMQLSYSGNPRVAN